MVGIRSQVDWFLDDLRVVQGASPNTVSNYRRDLTRYCQYVEDNGMSAWAQVAAPLVEKYLLALSETPPEGGSLSASSIARNLSAIRSFHKWLLREHITTSNPAATSRPPKQPSYLPKALTIDKVELILEGAQTGPPVRALRDSAFVEVLYGTGARVSEVTQLCVDDFALDAEFPHVRLTGKGNKERLVPIGVYALNAIQQYASRSRPALAARGKGTTALFLNLRGAPLSRQSGWEILQRAAKAGGLKESVSPHTLRHSYATHLLEGGATVREVQELLGHASVTTTQIYTHLNAQALQEMFQQSHPRAL